MAKKPKTVNLPTKPLAKEEATLVEFNHWIHQARPKQFFKLSSDVLVSITSIISYNQRNHWLETSNDEYDISDHGIEKVAAFNRWLATHGIQE